MKKILVLIPLLAALCGCTMGRIRPGHAYFKSADATAEAVQPQDPKEPMTQNVATETTEEKIIPAQSILEMGTGTNVQKLTLSEPMPVKTTSTKHSETKVGGAQKNTAQEIAAKLASVRWIQWLGVLVALFGVATIAYPPLRLIINSVTTSAWLIGAGAAMVFLPIVIVGHEVLIMAVGGGGAALWFLAHRHGGLSGELAALKSIFASPQKTAAPVAPKAAPADLSNPT